MNARRLKVVVALVALGLTTEATVAVSAERAHLRTGVPATTAVIAQPLTENIEWP